MILKENIKVLDFYGSLFRVWKHYFQKMFWEIIYTQ